MDLINCFQCGLYSDESVCPSCEKLATMRSLLGSPIDFPELAKASGLNQEQLAAYLGVSRISVNRWCTGRVAPKVSAARALLALKIYKTLTLI